MGYFPLCMDISEKTVLLIGCGKQMRDKEEKLRPFGAKLVQLHHLNKEALDLHPVFVVAGDLSHEEAEATAQACRERGIPVNVVDRPEISSFAFSSMITAGDLTVSISTGGKNPTAAAVLRGRIQSQIPGRTEEILTWLTTIRQKLRSALPPEEYPAVLRSITAAAFEENRPLTAEECRAYSPLL